MSWEWEAGCLKLFKVNIIIHHSKISNGVVFQYFKINVSNTDHIVFDLLFFNSIKSKLNMTGLYQKRSLQIILK